MTPPKARPSEEKKPHRAIQVFEFDENDKITFNAEEVLPILQHPDIKKKKVCVISIAGALRQGKSFILNFFIRYLSRTPSNGTEWLRPDLGPVSGFSWKPGSRRHTLGILMWSEVFLVKPPDSEEIAVIIMDTQGTFDNKSTLTQCASIFALSVLLSSLQIYNLKENIRQDDLSHLQMFSGYGRLMSTDRKPFQKLLFLIRDWQWSAERTGFQGNDLLGSVFQELETSGKRDLVALRNSISENFEEMVCFLLPHPGRAVATDMDFRGGVAEIDPEFIERIQELVPEILAPDKIAPKTVNNHPVTVEGLTDLMVAYWNHFGNGDIPTVSSAYAATAEAHHLMAIREALETYKSSMSKCSSTEQADEIRKRILKRYRSQKKLGSASTSRKYEAELNNKLKNIFYDDYKTTLEEQSFYYNIKSGIASGVASTTAVIGAAGLLSGSAVVEVAAACAFVGVGGLITASGVGWLALGGYKASKWAYNKYKAPKEEEEDEVEVEDEVAVEAEEEHHDVEEETGHMEKYVPAGTAEPVEEVRLGPTSEAVVPTADDGNNPRPKQSSPRNKRDKEYRRAVCDLSTLMGFLIGVVVILAIVVEWLLPFDHMRNK